MDFCSNVIRTLLVTFNIICLLCGLAILVVGAVILSGSSAFDSVISEIDSGLQAPPITLVVLGSIIFVVSFMGCCGALKENKCLLITYAVILILIFIVQLAIGIYAVITISQDSVNQALTNIFNRMDDHPEDAKIFHDLEVELKCCAVHGPHEYAVIPSSCYPNQSSFPAIPFLQGCGPAAYDWLQQAGKVVGGVALGLCIIEIFCAVSAIVAAKKVDQLY